MLASCDVNVFDIVCPPSVYYVLKRMCIVTRNYAGKLYANADPSSTTTMTCGERK
jgi:hypothetical protein